MSHFMVENIESRHACAQQRIMKSLIASDTLDANSANLPNFACIDIMDIINLFLLVKL